MTKSYYNIVETLVSICAVQDGEVNIFLKRKMTDPYKSYWILPNAVLSTEETLEESAKKIVKDATNLPSIYLTQTKTFSDIKRDPDNRIIACTYTALTAKELVKIKDGSDMKWFKLKELPKMGYDHETIIEENIKSLKHKIMMNENNVLFKLFPSDFTLPEFQKFFESLSGKELDRRNFRKKLITSGMVVDTGEKNTGGTGRPGKLYRLNPKFERYIK